MNNIYNIAIIGGGAAGLVSACFTACGQVVVLEKQERAGRKLGSTGNGRGNISNIDLSSDKFHSHNPQFFTHAIATYNIKELIAFYESLGGIVVSEDGKLFLNSYQASSIVDLLRNKISQKNIEVITGFNAASIKKTAGGFEISDPNRKIYARRVILACGGKSYGALGADDKSYDLAKRLGHKITDLKPAVCQLKTETKDIKNLDGIKQVCAVTLKSGSRIIKKTTQEIHFAAYGISGPAAFTLSSYVKHADQPDIEIDFMPDFSYEQTLKYLERNKLENNFTGILNKKIGLCINKFAKTNETRAKLAKCFPLKITGNTGFANAQITAGGVDTRDVDPKTMQSLLCKGLYFAGEMLDVDGDCGGYNLHFAFASGALAATAASNDK